jgi:hypothetical protein
MKRTIVLLRAGDKVGSWGESGGRRRTEAMAAVVYNTVVSGTEIGDDCDGVGRRRCETLDELRPGKSTRTVGGGYRERLYRW